MGRRMRSVLTTSIRSCLLCLATGCAPADPDPPSVDYPPDSSPINCDDSAAQFIAPQLGQHYDPNLVVIMHVYEHYVTAGTHVAVSDEQNKSYGPTADPTTTDLGDHMFEMRWPFELASSHRYDLYFWSFE